MPVTLGGMASGLDTDGIIEKLVDVEKKPIKQLEYGIKVNNVRKEALEKLRQQLNEINDASKDLYGFRASYDDKLAASSDPSVLNARASKLADLGSRKVQVTEVASTHMIASDAIDEKMKLSPGQFNIEVNGDSYSIKFKGGTLKNLMEKIQETAGESVSTSYVNTFDNNYIITIKSKVSGKKGEIKIKGDKTLLKEAGLVGGDKIKEKKGADIVFDQRYFTNYTGKDMPEGEKGSIEIDKEGKKISVKGLLWQEYVLPSELSIEKDTILEFDSNFLKQEEKEEPVPFKIEFGPDVKINVKGIELNGYNVSRIRPIDKKKDIKYDSLLGVGIVAEENGKRTEEIYAIDKQAKGKQEIPIGAKFAGRKINKLIFYCNDGAADFANARIVTPVKEEDLLEIKNQIAGASDAKLKVDGIEIIRDRNNDLNDVIKGLTLDLNRASANPVEINITPNVDKALEGIKRFVKAYNDYLDLHKQLIKTDKFTKPGEWQNAKTEKGLFVGDMTILRLESTIKTTVNGAYPGSNEKPIRILPQIGVSTGAINSEWESIKTGKLVVDDSLLKKIIIENPEGVRAFFGSDTDGDNKEDNGMAFTLIDRMKPYIGFGKNIIASKIDLENESIKNAGERIEKHEEHITAYERKLRQKFSTMEKAISGAKAQKNWMNMQMGNSGGDDFSKKGDK